MADVNGVNAANSVTPQQKTLVQPQGQDGIGTVPMTSGGGQSEAGVLGFTKQADKIKKDFDESGLGLTKEAVKAERKQLGIPTSGFLRNDKTDTIIKIHDEFALEMFSALYNENADEDIQQLAMQYIKELPKAQRNGRMAEYRDACQQKLDAFRAQVNDYYLAQGLAVVDENAENRFVTGEMTADLRAAATQKTVIEAGAVVIDEVNKHTDEVGAGLEKTVKDEGAATRKQVRATGNSVVKRVNAHTTKEANNVIDAGIQNTAALVGVGEADPEKGRMLTNGQYIKDEESATGQLKKHTTDEANRVIREDEQNRKVDLGIGKPDNVVDADPTRSYSPTVGGKLPSSESMSGQIRAEHIETRKEMRKTAGEIKEHVTKEHEKTREQSQANIQRQAVLEAKRQTLSDLLNEEITGLNIGSGPIGIHTGGIYRDKTIKWLGSAADRVMGDIDSDFATKKAALDELIRMVDEEKIIDDGDKKAFEDKYLKHPEKVVKDENVDDRQIS